jgi:HlyD family secretion protein
VKSLANSRRRHLAPTRAPVALRAVAASCAIAALACGCKSPDKEPALVVSVQVTPAVVESLAQTVSAQAVLSPLEQAVITPKITSTIKVFYVQRGTRVRKGQLLAVLENADLTAAAQQSKGEFEQAEAGYDLSTGASIPQDLQKAELDAGTAKINLEAQQKVYDSRKTLFDQGALPRRDLDAAAVVLSQAKNQYEVAERQLEDRQRLGQAQALKSAAAQLAAAKGKYLSAEAQLKYSEIRSPIDGVVTERAQFAGELATANQPLLTVMNTSKLIAKLHIAQSEAAALKVGNSAELHVAGLDEPVPARITLISPALDPGSTTLEVWVESLKPNAALKPGIVVQVNITAKTVQDAVAVPSAALFKTSEGADYLLLAGSDDHAHVKTVQVGIRTAGLTQITEGLKVGDRVISSGGYALPDGTEIKIVEASPSEGEAGKKTGAADGDEKNGATPATQKPPDTKEKE